MEGKTTCTWVQLVTRTCLPLPLSLPIIRLFFCETQTFCKFACFTVRRQYFSNPPDFCKSANIFQIRLIFWKAPIFFKSAWFSEKRQYFLNPPVFSKSARNLWICLIFVAANICVYFQYLFLHLSMRQYFWRNCFVLRFKIDIVVMIIWSIVIIINFVLTL